MEVLNNRNLKKVGVFILFLLKKNDNLDIIFGDNVIYFRTTRIKWILIEETWYLGSILE